ncbi:MAG: hypothetical protein ACI4VH_03340 [Clostridia bacterium]
MAKFLEGGVEMDTSSMTTEKLKEFIDKHQQIVDALTHEFCVRKMCEHKHRYKT